ncbi:hypothetical protein DJ010_00900 [Nocardioides silvaticus]|uniref:Uncharacterized protein n=1 Tax=Nocardioides silvaticus TaxID=2201891 RepID=A0A316TPW5_9ACTN|nr:hypothetical protein [Nocardioides silvaticus]PWN04244.1 hypothetical protein DJ010_00900 [Nocardioides silvaticus]
MSGIDLVTLAVVDAGLVAAALRLGLGGRSRGSTRLAGAAGPVLLAVAGVLLVAALPFGWARTAGDDLVSVLDARLASSPLAAAALVLSAITLGMVAENVRRGPSAAARLVAVVIGAGWTAVATDALLLGWQLDRHVTDAVQISPAPAVWLCLASGLVAISGARLARSAAVPLGGPPVRRDVDEWDVPVRSTPIEKGDFW